MLDKEIGMEYNAYADMTSHFMAMYLDRFKTAESTKNRTTYDIL
jgi:hypothetical protein